VTDIELLDSREAVKEIDRSDMLGVVARLPEMVSEAEKYTAGVILPRPKKISQVLFAGMGGSAIAGDMAADLYLKKAKVPLLSNRNYFLPEYAGPETLVFAISHSGETEEVLAAVRDAERKGASVVCITSGGKLKEIAAEKNYPLFLIPSGYPPRAALPFMLIPLLTSLGKLDIIPPIAEEVGAAVPFLKKLRGDFGLQKPARSNPVKQLAKKLVGRIPFILGSAGSTAAAALRMKTQFNENSKTTAVLSLFSELNHNEMVNLSVLKREEHNFALIILRDESDHEKVKQRIEITKSLIGRQMGGASEVASQGKSPLARILSLVWFGDYLSVYLAVLRDVDPTPVEVIARLKKELMR
jgi:glucose/mannose-6-phosphate isomerase